MRRAALAAAVLPLLATLAPPAAAQQTPGTDPNALVSPDRLDVPPPGRRLTGEQVQRIAERVPKVRRTRARHPGSFPNVFLKGPGRSQGSLFSRDKPPKEIAQVYVDDATGRATEAWTGFQVAWTMARGYPGAFGRKVNAPWVWIPLTVLFVLPFVDPRRPLRLLHLDLLVLAAFGVSLAFFNAARIGLSVPVLYPLLGYLLVRMLVLGLRRRDRPPEPLRLLVPASWLAIALVFLVGFRAASGDVPAAHAAAICFDLLCLALLFLIGRRVRGPDLGIALAYAWAAFPFTLYALETNVNDALVGALVLGALAAAASPAGRGALIRLAWVAKFAPLALAPLFATQTRGRVRYAVALGAVVAAGIGLVLAHGDLRTFYDRTIGFQAGREAPFSVWGLYGWSAAQAVVQGLAVILALAVAFVPRRRDLVGLAALSAAVLLALQLGVTYWFYPYVVWFFGPAVLALLGAHGSSTCSIASADRRFEHRMVTALSQGSSSAVSKRTDIWVRSDSMACSLRTPITPPLGPVIPTSVM